jgi:hypothetical protein
MFAKMVLGFSMVLAACSAVHAQANPPAASISNPIWSVDPKGDNPATIYMADSLLDQTPALAPPVVVYRICMTGGTSLGVEVKVNCGANGQRLPGSPDNPNPTSGKCVSYPLTVSTCMDVSANFDIVILRTKVLTATATGTYGLLR